MPSFDKRTAIVQSISPDLAYVPGNRTQLEEVILNLVVDACDAMEHHGGTLTVDARNVISDKSFSASYDVPILSDGSYVQIRVSDTGCGLSPEARDHPFEPFFTTRPEGTKFGLSIVWRVVHDHSGTITVASVPNQGTTFTLYLPAVSRVKAQGRARQTPVSGSLPRSARGESVLIVDDEDVVRSVAVKVLSGLGYHVIDAIESAAAFALKNLLGLVCDPVAGLVEIPCVKRNVVASLNAVANAEMALVGIRTVLPFDEVVQAMDHIGKDMSASLKETSMGGLAVTPTAVRIMADFKRGRKSASQTTAAMASRVRSCCCGDRHSRWGRRPVPVMQRAHRQTVGT
jgi:CheY-like chemotaxis protein